MCNLQKQPPEVFKGVLRNFAKFTGKRLCQSLIFNKVYRTFLGDPLLWLQFKNRFKPAKIMFSTLPSPLLKFWSSIQFHTSIHVKLSFNSEIFIWRRNLQPQHLSAIPIVTSMNTETEWFQVVIITTDLDIQHYNSVYETDVLA